MKILMLGTKTIIDCEASLALRRIEQGKAVPVNDTSKKTAKVKPDAGDA